MCSFSIDFQDSPDMLIIKASAAISQAGGVFDGGDQTGNFSITTPLGNIAGNYSISGQTALFNITKKPFLVGCGRIEDELRKYLA